MMTSEPGYFLSGQPMPPATHRLRPFGCVAVIANTAKGSVLTYQRNAEQERIDTELERR